ncbi:four-carbon acid sugar kinase family protein [Arthrobacter sp. GCM10027362]|uniref:four-carbon acid sugar kinase family protein n=1 Tax=Arthrobacter sp. GCM10027362 TaxID=3273379 RepID=UPI003645D40A
MLSSELLSNYPPEVQIPAYAVSDVVAASGRTLVVLDDDPTGTQSVADLPVLTGWEVEDFRWALAQHAPAIYVLTNSRSLDPGHVGQCNREVVTNALAAAGSAPLGFVSRSDSTLRGHYPLEPNIIAEVLEEVSGDHIDGVVIVPAFPEAGRVTIGGVHYVRGDGDVLTPVAETEFAQDATFGFRNSELAKYVEEKSAGQFPASEVIALDLNTVRGGTGRIADALVPARDSTPIVVDIVTENDLRALALGLDEAERRGQKLLYRVGPPFVRARIGQEPRPPLTAAEAYAGTLPASSGGLVVVGSHVGLTTRQLHRLTENHPLSRIVEIQVENLLKDEKTAAAELDTAADTVVAGLAEGDVVVHTSRVLVKAGDPAESLRIARTVSAAVVDVVQRTLARKPPRFVIAKGGITSSDVARHGLQIRHAMVRGPMLPGVVSLWEPVGGPAKGIPYVVFPGNVGNDAGLLDVVRTLSSHPAPTGTL